MSNKRPAPAIAEILQHHFAEADISGAEVGVFHGTCSAMLLEKLPALTLFCIDPWSAEYNTNHGAPGRRMSRRTQDSFDEIYAEVVNKLARYGDRAVIERTASPEAADLFEDETLDFVFVDAIHSYEAVRADLVAWWPKVVPSGLLMCHDYCDRFPGTPQAFDEFTAQQGLSQPIVGKRTVAYVVKQ